MTFRVLSLFAGIGGFDLGLERTGGFRTVAFCEIEPFCQRILKQHWPEVPCYGDVRELTAERLRADGIVPDVICGGFPCQDISVAGRREGITDGTRSGLWSEVARLIGELRPSYAIVENVANLLSGPSERPGGWFGRILGDLAELGYDAEWENIPAAALGAPHRRERIWITAYASEIRRDAGRAGQPLQGIGLAREASLADAYRARLEGRKEHRECPDQRLAGQGVRSFPGSWCAEPALGRVANGVPNRVDRIAALGNAVVPQIPELIGRAILASLNEREMAA
jgi:DNA (cytosine-5)-methyltransferase 1